jgi:hypothetical protein
MPMRLVSRRGQRRTECRAPEVTQLCLLSKSKLHNRRGPLACPVVTGAGPLPYLRQFESQRRERLVYVVNENNKRPYQANHAKDEETTDHQGRFNLPKRR